METGAVDLLRYAGYACLIGAVLLLAITVFLFFKMKIRDVINELSGKARVTSTTKMQDSYEVTGSLRKSSDTSEDLYDGDSGVETDRLKKGGSDSKTKTNKLNQKTADTNVKAGATTKKSDNSSKNMVAGFRIIKDDMVIHTNERIS